MKARLLIRRRLTVRDAVFAELVLWEVPSPAAGSRHLYRYSLALVSEGSCVLRYDNEAGKGDHIHTSDQERRYAFSAVDRLIADFIFDMDQWIHEHGDP